MSKTTIHVYDKNYDYVGNIMYTYSIPMFTEEKLLDLIITHFPFLKDERWYVTYS